MCLGRRSKAAQIIAVPFSSSPREHLSLIAHLSTGIPNALLPLCKSLPESRVSATRPKGRKGVPLALLQLTYTTRATSRQRTCQPGDYFWCEPTGQTGDRFCRRNCHRTG